MGLVAGHAPEVLVINAGAFEPNARLLSSCLTPSKATNMAATSEGLGAPQCESATLIAPWGAGPGFYPQFYEWEAEAPCWGHHSGAGWAQA